MGPICLSHTPWEKHIFWFRKSILAADLYRLIPPPPLRINESAHLMAAAGLLHDVGKVAEPSGRSVLDTISDLESQVCPASSYTGGRRTHRHALHTADVLERLNTKCDWGGLNYHKLFRIASYHHNPSSGELAEELLCKADRLASGLDRQHNELSDQAVTGLDSVFMHLRIRGQQGSDVYLEDRAVQIPPSELCFNDKFMPGTRGTLDSYRDACKRVTDRFEEVLTGKYLDPRSFVESLFSISSRLFVNLPSSRRRQENPDISLHDHARAVAAIAGCLGAMPQNDVTDGLRMPGRYRFINYEIGGIQRFVFRHIPPIDGAGARTKGRAKLLRARSFYVSLLSALIGRRILDTTGLPITNLILEAGGHGVLLIPDTDDVLDKVYEAEKYIRHWIDSELLGTIRLRLTVGEPLGDNVFSQTCFGLALRSISEAAASSELNCYRSCWSSSDSCWHSDDAAWLGSTYGLPVDDPEFDRMMVKLGQQLPRCKYIGIQQSDACTSGSHLTIVGYNITLSEQIPECSRYYALNLPSQLNIPYLVISNYIPIATEEDVRTASNADRCEDDFDIVSGAPLPLDFLAQRSRDPDTNACYRFPMLAALKADVDNLGYLMAYGFTPQGDRTVTNRATLGRIAAMSRSLDLFFRGYLDTQIRNSYRNVYSVFSGGDDLFLIGPWFDMVQLADSINDWLHTYTVHNPAITLSAGIVFAKPRTPISSLAEQAEASLTLAKDGGRNKIVVMGLPLSWAQLKKALSLHRIMRRAATVNDHQLRATKSLVYRCLRYADMAINCTTDECRLSDLKWRSQLNYDLARNLPIHSSESVSDDDKELHRHLININETDAGVLRVAASLTLYSLRGDDDGKTTKLSPTQ
ncbi:MAG: HD domain-containing protein [Gammaproteobacteria bacterium]|nr:MAG: HD domain-containing protein [Gammaproteobacteria bacterium]